MAFHNVMVRQYGRLSRSSFIKFLVNNFYRFEIRSRVMRLRERHDRLKSENFFKVKRVNCCWLLECGIEGKLNSFVTKLCAINSLTFQ